MLSPMARPARTPFPPAHRAKSRTYSARVYVAPAEKKRTLARLMRSNNGEVPSSLKPRLSQTFDVTALTLVDARALVEKKIKGLGLTLRSINRGHRDFIVYVAHTEDT